MPKTIPTKPNKVDPSEDFIITTELRTDSDGNPYQMIRLSSDRYYMEFHALRNELTGKAAHKPGPYFILDASRGTHVIHAPIGDIAVLDVERDVVMFEEVRGITDFRDGSWLEAKFGSSGGMRFSFNGSRLFFNMVKQSAACLGKPKVS